MGDVRFMEPEIELREALARMPLESPSHSAWPAMAKALARPSRPRWPIGLAAGLLALALLPLDRLERAKPAVPLAAASTNPQAIARLMQESAQLERVVAAASDEGASNAAATVLSLDMEDRLQELDARLQAGGNDTEQLLLWQQRVQLLRSVAAVETSRHYLASEGRSFDVALVAAY